VAWAAIFGAALTALGDALMPGQLRTHLYVVNPFGVVGVIGGRFTTYEIFAASIVFGTALLATSALAALSSLVLRLRRARGDERQQLKWFLYAAAPAVVSLSPLLLDAMLVNFTTNFGDNTQYIVSWQVLTVSIYVAVCASLVVPVFTYIAILRYRLYDIDVIINRTLLYSALSACVVGLYVLVVAGAGALFQIQGSFVVSLLAVGLVAVVFQPLRNRLQRGVNRLVYGQRDEPYVVLSRLGQRLEGTLAPEEALSTIVETVTQALKLPYAAITLEQDGTFVTAAEHGSPVGGLVTLPLVYHAEEVGRLMVTPRIPGEAFASADRRLLDDLAHQAGAAAHAVRLTADLQRSRERLVTAREEERRRLRRDLHDGVGPQLAALMLELETAGDLVSGNPEASVLMAKLSERARETVSDVRRSVHALRPPALDELGLLGALEEGAAQYGRAGGLRVWVEAPEELPPLAAAVEVACYRIAQEAMTNAVRHAEADNCWVRVTPDADAGTLRLEVEDDGRGIRENAKAGVGMNSMRERAEELGGRCTIGLSARGGTLVRALLPCRTADDPDRNEE
jgi:signal transduction histidine kinase